MFAFSFLSLFFFPLLFCVGCTHSVENSVTDQRLFKEEGKDSLFTTYRGSKVDGKNDNTWYGGKTSNGVSHGINTWTNGPKRQKNVNECVTGSPTYGKNERDSLFDGLVCSCTQHMPCGLTSKLRFGGRITGWRRSYGSEKLYVCVHSRQKIEVMASLFSLPSFRQSQSHEREADSVDQSFMCQATKILICEHHRYQGKDGCCGRCEG